MQISYTAVLQLLQRAKVLNIEEFKIKPELKSGT